MTEFGQSLLQKTFVGEVSDPFCSLKITKGLVEFKVRSLQGSLLLSKTAQLISASGEVYPVLVCAMSIMHPSRDPREFQLRVAGIDIEKAKEMRKLIQEHDPD